VANVFTVPRSSDHRLWAEAAVPLSLSISVIREGEKENTENETKKKWRKRRKNEKKKRNHKPAGTAFRSLLSFSAYKICRTGKKKVQKTRRKREERRLQR
jgi:hypothetical protein